MAGSHFHADDGLYPVRRLLELHCGISRTAGSKERLELLEAEVRSRLLNTDEVVPLLAPVLGIGAVAGYEPPAAKGRQLYELVGAAVENYLLACVGDRVGVLVADDVHWFDPSTVEMLGSLLDAAAGRLLVVATGRPGSWLPAHWPVAVHELTLLTDEQADELIATLDSRLSETERAAVRARCDGVPFYLEQVVGVLDDVDDEHAVPEALYEPLLSRLRARPNAVPVIQAAAAIGRHVDRALLRSTCELDDDEIDRVITDLVDVRVLETWVPTVGVSVTNSCAKLPSNSLLPACRARTPRPGSRGAGRNSGRAC